MNCIQSQPTHAAASNSACQRRFFSGVLRLLLLCLFSAAFRAWKKLTSPRISVASSLAAQKAKARESSVMQAIIATTRCSPSIGNAASVKKLGRRFLAIAFSNLVRDFPLVGRLGKFTQTLARTALREGEMDCLPQFFAAVPIPPPP